MNRTDRPSPMRRTIAGWRDAHRRTSIEWQQRMEIAPDLRSGLRS